MFDLKRYAKEKGVALYKISRAYGRDDSFIRHYLASGRLTPEILDECHEIVDEIADGQEPARRSLTLPRKTNGDADSYPQKGSEEWREDFAIRWEEAVKYIMQTPTETEPRQHVRSISGVRFCSERATAESSARHGTETRCLGIPKPSI